jgi:hypothetical protein
MGNASVGVIKITVTAPHAPEAILWDDNSNILWDDNSQILWDT